VRQQKQTRLVSSALSFDVSMGGTALVYTSAGEMADTVEFLAVDPNADEEQESDDDEEDDHRLVRLNERVSVVVHPGQERKVVFMQICDAVRQQIQLNPGLFGTLLRSVGRAADASADDDRQLLLKTWQPVCERYRDEVLPFAQSSPDFVDMVRELLAELQMSHVYYFPAGSGGSLHLRRGSGQSQDEDQGSLCCDTEWDSGVQGYRLLHIFKGDVWDVDAAGPLAYLADVFHEGDIILAVDGTRLTPTVSLPQALQHHADKHIIVEFVPACCARAASGLVTRTEGSLCEPHEHDDLLPTQSAGADEAPRAVLARLQRLYKRSRRVWVRAVDTFQDEKVRYRDRVTEALATVRAFRSPATGRFPDLVDGIGYVQITEMTRTGFAEFHRCLSTARAALIVDVRGNAGGSVAEQILRYLSTPQLGWDVPGSSPMPWPANSLRSPGLVVLLTNENCFSDADALAFGWKKLGFGPVVGTRTFGGLLTVTGDKVLLDASELTLPSEYFVSVDGDLSSTDPTQHLISRSASLEVENHGVEPDYWVELPPMLPCLGVRRRDPQLEVAISVLVDKLAAARERTLATRDAHVD